MKAKYFLNLPWPARGIAKVNSLFVFKILKNYLLRATFSIFYPFWIFAKKVVEGFFTICYRIFVTSCLCNFISATCARRNINPLVELSIVGENFHFLWWCAEFGNETGVSYQKSKKYQIFLFSKYKLFWKFKIHIW